VRTGGDPRNREFAGPHVTIDADETAAALAYDPQTAGGLLVSLPEERAAVALAALSGAGVDACRIGSVVDGAGVHLGA
jgi:selenide,water dikinase